MPTAEIKGIPIAYEFLGTAGPVWVVTPGGRYSKDKESLERNPGERQRLLDQDRATFVATMERWMAASQIGFSGLSRRWHELVPSLQKWAQETIFMAVKG